MDQPSPPKAGRQLVDGYCSRHRKEVSEGHGIAVCARSGGHINMEFSGFEGIPEEGGRVAGGWGGGGGGGGGGYGGCGSAINFYEAVGADL